MAQRPRGTRASSHLSSFFVPYLLLGLLLVTQRAAGGGFTVLSRTKAFTYDVAATTWSTTADLSGIAPFDDGVDEDEADNMACAVLQTPHFPEDAPYAICDYEETCNTHESQRLIQYDVVSGQWQLVTPHEKSKLPPARGAQLIRVRSDPDVSIDILFASACGGDVYVAQNSPSASTAPPAAWERHELSNINAIQCIAAAENGYFVVIEQRKFTLFKAEASTAGNIDISLVRMFSNLNDEHEQISKGRGCATTTAPDGTIFVSGGTSETGRRVSSLRWTVKLSRHVTKTKISIADLSATVEVLEKQLPYGRRDHAMLYHNNGLYVFGGVTFPQTLLSTRSTKRVHRLDLSSANSAWMDLAPLPDEVPFPGASYIPAASTTLAPTTTESCPPAILFLSVGASEIRMSRLSTAEVAAWDDAVVGKIEDVKLRGVNLGLIDGEFLLTGGCSTTPSAVAHLTLSNGQAMVQFASMQALAFYDCDESTALLSLASHVCSLRQSRAQEGDAKVLQCAPLSAVDSAWVDMSNKIPTACRRKTTRWFASGGQLWCGVIASRTNRPAAVTLMSYELDVPGGTFAKKEDLRFTLVNSLPLTATLRAMAATEHHLAFVVDTLLCVYIWGSNVDGSCRAMPEAVSNGGTNLQLSLMDGIVVAAVHLPNSDMGSTVVRVAGVISDVNGHAMVEWNTPQSIKVGSDERVWLLQGPLCGQNLAQVSTPAATALTTADTDMLTVAPTRTTAEAGTRTITTTADAGMLTLAPATIFKKLHFDMDFDGLRRDVLRDGIKAALVEREFSPPTLTRENIRLEAGSVIGTVPVLTAKAEDFDDTLCEGLEIQYIDMETVIAYNSATNFPSASREGPPDTSSPTNAASTSTTTTVASASGGSSSSGGGAAAGTAIGAAVGAVIGVLCLVLAVVYVRRSRASPRSSKRAALGQTLPFMLNNPMFDEAHQTPPTSSGRGLQSQNNYVTMTPPAQAVYSKVDSDPGLSVQPTYSHLSGNSRAPRASREGWGALTTAASPTAAPSAEARYSRLFPDDPQEDYEDPNQARSLNTPEASLYNVLSRERQPTRAAARPTTLWEPESDYAHLRTEPAQGRQRQAGVGGAYENGHILTNSRDTFA